MRVCGSEVADNGRLGKVAPTLFTWTVGDGRRDQGTRRSKAAASSRRFEMDLHAPGVSAWRPGGRKPGDWVWSEPPAGRKMVVPPTIFPSPDVRVANRVPLAKLECDELRMGRSSWPPCIIMPNASLYYHCRADDSQLGSARLCLIQAPTPRPACQLP